MRAQSLVRNGAVILGVALVAALLGVLALGGRAEPPGAALAPTQSPGQPRAGGLETFTGDGYAFEYPAAWGSYPVQMTASFFSVVGYLASEPIDTSRICTTIVNGTSCNFRGYDLHPGNVAIEIAGWGTPMDDPLAFWDGPTDGRRILVGGAPAIISQEAAGPGRVVLTWKIARPDSLDNWIQLDADVLGPGDALVRSQVDALIASFRVVPPPMPLDVADGDRIGNCALAAMRADDPEAYACFPPVGHSMLASVTAVPGMQLRQALPAMCTTRLTATDLGFWRMDLVVGWGADPAHPTLHYTSIQWLRGDGTPIPIDRERRHDAVLLPRVGCGRDRRAARRAGRAGRRRRASHAGAAGAAQRVRRVADRGARGDLRGTGARFADGPARRRARRRWPDVLCRRGHRLDARRDGSSTSRATSRTRWRWRTCSRRSTRARSR